MSTRPYQFINGPKTSNLPTVADPVNDEDFGSKGYNDARYARRLSWWDKAASVSAIRAILSTDVENGTKIFNYGDDTDWKFDSSSTGVDDGATILKPNDLGGGDPGRWLLVSSGGGATTEPNNYELMVEKIDQEHYQQFTSPVAQAVYSGFEESRQEWEGRLLESYPGSGTTLKFLVNPLFINSADPSFEDDTAWTGEGGAINLTNDATVGEFKIGAQSIVFDKDNTTTHARIYFDPTDLGVSQNKYLWFWVKMPSITQLNAFRITIAKDTGMTDYSEWDVTLDYAGAGFATGWKLYKLDVSTAATNTVGAGWDYLSDSIARFKFGVVTAASTQTYTAIKLDGFMWADSTGLYYNEGEKLTIYDTSNRAGVTVDIASTNYQGVVTITGALANSYTAGNDTTDTKLVRCVPTIEAGTATPKTGLSGSIANTQEVRLCRHLPVALSSDTVCSYTAFDSKKVLRVTAVNSGVSVEVDDPGNNSAQFLNTNEVYLIEVRPSDGREYYKTRSTVYTMDGNATHLSGTTTIPLASTTSISVGDILIKKQLEPKASCVSVGANENFQSMTFSEFIVNNDGLPYPGGGYVYGHYMLGGTSVQQATRNLRGTGGSLLQNGTVPRNIPFFSRQLAAGQFSSVNYYTLPGSGVALRSDTAGETVSGSLWFYITGTVVGDYALVGNYNTTSNGWWFGVRGGSGGGIALVTEGTVDGATPAVPTGQWVHFAFTLQGEANPALLWVDGSLTTFAMGASNYSAANVIGIGETLTTSPFTIGYIADVILWDDYALTQANVNKLYNQGVHRKVGSHDAYALKWEKTGMSGDKLTIEETITRATDADDIYLTGLGLIKC